MSNLDIDQMIRRLDDLAQGYQWSQVLFRAVHADIFTHTRNWNTSEAVATAVKWDARATRMMLDALASQGLLEKERGRYRNSPVAAQCLLPGAPSDQTHILRHKAYGWDTWGQLETALQTGTGVLREEKTRSDEELRAFICGMADVGRQSAQRILEALDLSKCKNLLDIGAGPGTYAIAFCKAHPEMRATLFDLEDVLPIAREEVEAVGLEDRISYRAGDLTTDSFGSGFDLIFVSNIIHSYDEATNRALVQRCHDALSSGGMLIIKDFLVDADAVEPAFNFLFALHMLVHTEAGDIYTTAQVADWTREAGFADGDYHALAPQVRALTSQTRMWCVTKP